MTTIMRKFFNVTFFLLLSGWLASDLATGDRLRGVAERTGIRSCYALADIRDVVGERMHEFWDRLDAERKAKIKQWEELGKVEKAETKAE